MLYLLPMRMHAQTYILARTVHTQPRSSNLRSGGGRTSAKEAKMARDMEVKPIQYRDISQRLWMQQVHYIGLDFKKRTI